MEEKPGQERGIRFLDIFAVCCIVLCLVALYGMLRPKMQEEKTHMLQETPAVTQPPETAPPETEAPVEQLRQAEVGQTVFFGTFEQDGITDNGAESIQWTVLSKEEGRILVISKYILDWRPYHMVRVPVTWEECTLRAWLNGDFLKNAFTDEEQAKIPTVTNPPCRNPNYATDPGSATEDRIFLLSPRELKQYTFEAWQATAWAMAQGAPEETGHWWLRAPGNSLNNAARTNGTTLTDDHVNRRSGIRPALWLETE